MSKSFEEVGEEQKLALSSDKKVSDTELVEKYQKHFDKNMAMKLLVKLRKSTRDKPKVIAGATGVVTAVGIYSDLSLEKLDEYIDSMEDKK